MKTAKYAELVASLGKQLKLRALVKAQKEAAKAAKRARELYEEYLKG